jgi:hypothetical protein
MENGSVGIATNCGFLGTFSPLGFEWFTHQWFVIPSGARDLQSPLAAPRTFCVETLEVFAECLVGFDRRSRPVSGKKTFVSSLIKNLSHSRQ